MLCEMGNQTQCESCVKWEMNKCGNNNYEEWAMTDMVNFAVNGEWWCVNAMRCKCCGE